MSVADKLRIRVNPDFNHEVEPEDNEFAYVNPVTLNNDLIRLGNEMLTLAKARVDANKRCASWRLEKRKVERQLEDREEALLRDNPLTGPEAKSLKTISAAVARRVQETMTAEQKKEYNALRARVRELEDEIERDEGYAKTAQIYWDTAERLCDNITTHLSYVKDDRRRSGYGA